jgi:protein O-mannosyl-transferase
MSDRPGEGAAPEAFAERDAREADDAREGRQEVVAARDLAVSLPSPRVPLRTSLLARARVAARGYVLDRNPTFLSLLAPLLVVALVLFTRFPGTNYIFDEQEALLANPYVNASAGLRFLDAIHRDFWGLPADRSVGSYRPIPDMLWRALWSISKQPFFHHIYNVVFHAVNGAVIGRAVFSWTRRRGTAALAGLAFVACAVLTEAVSGIVGIADVLGGMGAVLALAALSLPAWAMPSAVFAAVLFGLFCKESALVCVPLVPFAALVLAPLTHPGRPARIVRAALALLAAGGAFFLYVELRKRWFLSPLPQELVAPLPADASRARHLAHDFLVWFHQAPLPKDPLNNPLAEADMPHRVAGALRVYLRGLGQVVFPKSLSGDYSFPQEPVPSRLISPESIGGAAMMILPLLVGAFMWIASMVRERRARRGEEGVAIAFPYREAAPLPESVDPVDVARRRMLRVLGVVVLMLAGAVVVVAGLLRKRPELFADARLARALAHVEGRPLALAAVPLLMLGVGLILEGLRPLPRPDAPEAPVPLRRAGLALGAVGLVWIVVSYFPHSNIPAVLPTVRAERFWYFPAVGSSMVIAAILSAAFEATRRKAVWLVPAIGAAFFLFQGVAAYRHSMDYRSDLDFWEATKGAVPRSAKAHLNYSVMKGARGDLNVRLEESRVAMELAPKWPMAHVYTGDVLCRMHRAEEAWAHYKEGFALGPNELSLIALALQCMHDENALKTHDAELRALADQHEGSWIAYLAIDTLNNHEKNKGVDPKYRPRGYNEGPKE